MNTLCFQQSFSHVTKHESKAENCAAKGYKRGGGLDRCKQFQIKTQFIPIEMKLRWHVVVLAFLW